MSIYESPELFGGLLAWNVYRDQLNRNEGADSPTHPIAMSRAYEVFDYNGMRISPAIVCSRLRSTSSVDEAHSRMK